MKVNQIHNFISSSGSGTVINYGSVSDFNAGATWFESPPPFLLTCR